MIKLETNSGKDIRTHDSIKYDSLEKQMFNIFKKHFEKVDYKVKDKVFYILTEGVKIIVEVKKSLTLVVDEPDSYEGDKYGYQFMLGDYNETSKIRPKVSLPYNQEIDKKLLEFFDKVKHYSSVLKKAEPFYKWIEKNKEAYQESILSFLKKKFETDVLTVCFWLDNRDFFECNELCFHMHPKEKAPADGAFLCFEKNTHEINPFWNHSTGRRSGYGDNKESIEDAFRLFDTGKGVAVMKAKIKELESLTEKINSFNVKECPELMEIFAKKAEVDKLLAELKAPAKSSPKKMQKA